LSAPVSAPQAALGTVPAMVVYTHRLGGRLTAVAPGELTARLVSETAATFDAHLSFADERRFGMRGEIRFGEQDSVRFRTLEQGRLHELPRHGLRHGGAVLLGVVFATEET
jgi:hypothetical protein